MKIKKIADFEYEVVDPVTGGLWKVVSGGPLTDIGIYYAVTDALFREGARPDKGVTMTVAFSFGSENEENPKSEVQKLLESLASEHEL